jgi:hypothetical protein
MTISFSSANKIFNIRVEKCHSVILECSSDPSDYLLICSSDPSDHLPILVPTPPTSPRTPHAQQASNALVLAAGTAVLAALSNSDDRVSAIARIEALCGQVGV